MRVYIASPYKRKKDINTKIYNELRKRKINVFLPKEINIDAVAERPKEQFQVAEICYNEIEQCNIILMVWEFGRSVSSEIGYAIHIKRSKIRDLKLVLWNSGDKDIDDLKGEAMIWPYVDKTVDGVEELVEYLKAFN